MRHSEDDERLDSGEASGRHVPKNRHSSASKLRRSPQHCPICLAPLANIAGRTRRRRSCTVCGATVQPHKRCAKCRAEAIWESRGRAACRSCGLHGKKAAVIAINGPAKRSEKGGVVDHARFAGILAERFPDIATSVDDCSRGLLHLEMGTLARATQAAISAEDVETVQRHFEFVDEIFRVAAPDVENAIYVSYLEHLAFDGRHGKRIRARELLSPCLRKALADLEEHLNTLFGNPAQR